MPVICKECPESRQIEAGKSATLLYSVSGTADTTAVLNALAAAAPATVEGLIRQSNIKIEPLFVDTKISAARCKWRGTVSYASWAPQQPKQVGETVFNFEVGGGTQHITHSIYTMGKYGAAFAWPKWASNVKYSVGAHVKIPGPPVPPGAKPVGAVFQKCIQKHTSSTANKTDPEYWTQDSPDNYVPADFGGAINVTKDSVEGCDIGGPGGGLYNFSVTKYFESSAITAAYRLAVAHLIMSAPVSVTGFYGHAVGEVRIVQIRGGQRGREDWELTFDFAVSENKRNFYVGDILIPEKFGWDYLWERCADTMDGETLSVVKRPVAVYIERVYGFGNFAVLGL